MEKLLEESRSLLNRFPAIIYNVLFR